MKKKHKHGDDDTPKRRFIYRGPNYPVPADVVGPELERIWREHDEKLMPADVVDAAREESAPLHSCFEWNDAAAGDKYRLHQARNLTRSVQVIVEGGEPETLFVHVHVEKHPPHYQHTSVIVSKPDEYTAACEELHRKLLQLMSAYRELKARANQAGAESEVGKIAAIVEALATARTLSERLQ